MKIDRVTKLLLGIVSILLLLNLFNSFLSSKSVLAVSQDEKKGRYQISAWGSEAASSAAHSGYYILDTATGEIVAGKMEVHQR